MFNSVKMDLAQAVEWSREEKISLSCDVVLSNVLMEVGNDTVTKVLNTVKVFGRTKIHGV